jgi:exodeoxyribonuclease-3
MRIATWNVNSVKQRAGHLVDLIAQERPDVLCLQELKCLDAAFPSAEVEALGYNVATFGQKAFNGVALLSRHPLSDVMRGLPGDGSDEQARYIEALVEAPGGPVRVGSIYLPNGNPVDTGKFAYKLDWMARLRGHASRLLENEECLVLAGDYNVIPDARDVYDASAWAGDALYRPESRAAFRSLLALGLTDAVRAGNDESGLYTFWDYQAGAWQRNKGIRIDHLLLSPQAADRLVGADIHKQTRGWDKPSDHVPVSVLLDLSAPGARPAPALASLRLELLDEGQSRAALVIVGGLERLLVQARDPAVALGVGAVLGQGEPHQPARPLRRHAFPVDEKLSEQRLGGRVALLGREVEPPRRLPRVAIDSGALEVEAGEVKLRGRIAEIGGRELEHLDGPAGIGRDIAAPDPVEQIAAERHEGAGDDAGAR